MKDLGMFKTIIRWQITRDIIVQTMKINQLAFIRDLVIEKKLTECNTNIIPIKPRSAIEMFYPKNYKKTDICIY